MTFNIAELVLNAEAEAFITLLDGGTCELRTGVQPATITDPVTGILLATIVLPATALSAPATGGTAILASTIAVAAIADGTVGYARFKKSDNSTVFDGAVTLSGGGGDVLATAVALLISDLVNILLLDYTRS